MFKTLSFTGAALAMGAAALAPTAAEAQRYDRYDGPRYERDYHDVQYRPAYRNDRRVYRGYDRRYQNRRCDAGTGGTVIGAIAGGLLGNAVAGRGDRTLGTVIGAVGGGLAGRAIDRSDNPRRCR